MLENLVPKCVPEDSESSSGDEVEANKLQDNEQSSENVSLTSRTNQKISTRKRYAHDIESSVDENNYEKNFPDLRPPLYTTYTDGPTKNNVSREISWTSTVHRLGGQPRSAVILGQPGARRRALQANTQEKRWDLFFSDHMLKNASQLHQRKAKKLQQAHTTKYPRDR